MSGRNVRNTFDSRAGRDGRLKLKERVTTNQELRHGQNGKVSQIELLSKLLINCCCEIYLSEAITISPELDDTVNTQGELSMRGYKLSCPSNSRIEWAEV